MSRINKKYLVAGVAALLAVGFALPPEAEAGRYRRVVRRAYRPAVVVAPRAVVVRPYVRRSVVVARPVVAAPVVHTAPVVYSNHYVTPVVSAPYVTVGGGGVHVAAPYVGVNVGW
ncbi:hypothetical protein MalM25_04150 [Planctomycetes bacterium MalM25]|nr:hypothetical protein MalM25_04150 [Planctomycetes bacterium MalM25]